MYDKNVNYIDFLNLLIFISNQIKIIVFVKHVRYFKF